MKDRWRPCKFRRVTGSASPGWLPFAEVWDKRSDYPNGLHIWLGQYLSLTEVPLEARSYLDSENADLEEMIWINGHEDLLIEKEGAFTLTWSAHERIFVLSYKLSLEEMMKVAESGSYKEK